MFGITPSARLRPSPFDEATLAAGVTAFTTYNHMLMPTSYGSPEKEYWRLLRGVSPASGRLSSRAAMRDGWRRF